MTTMSATLTRRALASDAEVIADHRVAMFSDLGLLNEALRSPMREASIAWLGEAIPRDEYVGYLAYLSSEPHHIIAGVGMLLRNAPPTVTRTAAPELKTGLQALVINVYTEREWRGKGIARQLMSALLEDARHCSVIDVVLHASVDGRHLYETLGFVPTNEMRLTSATTARTRT